MDFKSLVNQETVKTTLVRTADREQLPNGYLFYGAEGVGKWSAALALTAYLNCKDPSNGDSCGKCGPCRQISKLQYANLFIAVPTPPSKSEKEEYENYWAILKGKIDEPYSLIGGKRQMSIPVNTVREIRRSLGQKPPLGGYRVVLIEQMDRMRTSSADALLKLIEEPPPKTLLIITTARPEKLLPTVISRCRKVRFGNLDEQSISSYITDHCEIEPDQAMLLARLSNGSLGRALYLADEENSQDRELAKAVFTGLFRADAGQVIAEAHDLLPLDDRFRINRIIAAWQSLFRDLILLRNGASRDILINIDFAGQLEKLSGNIAAGERLLKIPAYLGEISSDIDLNVDTRTAISSALIHIKKNLAA